jgi:hypothetical protein
MDLVYVFDRWVWGCRNRFGLGKWCRIMIGLEGGNYETSHRGM